MTSIHYVARTASGRLVEGVVAEAERESVILQLKDYGLELVNIKEDKAPKPRVRARALGDSESAALARDLATIMSAGVPLGDGLRDLAIHAPPPRQQLFQTIATDVESGQSLADALEARGELSPQFVAAVRAGERSGSLDTTLNRLAEHLEWRAAMRAQVIPAIAYPAGLMLASFSLVALVAFYLVPKLAEPLLKVNVELPWITKAVLAGSHAVQNYGLYILAGIVICAGGLFAYRATRAGRLRFDHYILKTPILGTLWIKAAGAEFAATLGTLYRAGLPLNESLELMEQGAQNRAIAERLRGVRESIIAGGGLAEASIRKLQFPPLVGRLLAIGERTGTLETSLERISQQLERELRAATKKLISIGEPAAILVAGAGIGIAVFAAILPLFRMLEAVRR
ncbi:MAG: type II secretion system F family protein [Planctomycetota bacterium]